MIKLTKNQFIEILKSADFKRVGHLKTLNRIEERIKKQNWTWEMLEDNYSYKVLSIHSTFIKHIRVDESDNPCRETFQRFELYMMIHNDVRYLIHANKDDEGIVWSVSVKAMKVEE